MRNYIAHDYEGINLGVIEHIIRDKLPNIKAISENLLSPLERVANAQKKDTIDD